MNVKVIEQRRAAALVEWRDGTGIHRATIPARVITGEGEHTQAPYRDLEQGVPYGEAWELLPLGEIGARSIANALRESGIWTTEQAAKQVNEVRMALLTAYGEDLKKILDLARQRRNGR